MSIEKISTGYNTTQNDVKSKRFTGMVKLTGRSVVYCTWNKLNSKSGGAWVKHKNKLSKAC